VGEVHTRGQRVRREEGGQRLQRPLGCLPGPCPARSRRRRFLGERYRQIARRCGAEKAIVAIGRSILVIVWHLLSDPAARYHDLGSEFFDRHINPERRKRALIHQLEALGYKVTLEPAA
jgi:hypothetical protein